MKKIAAKFLMWCLSKLGYESDYTKIHEIKISVDSREAERSLQRLSFQAEKLRKELESVNSEANRIALQAIKDNSN